MRIGNIVFDCTDPARMAAFWAQALGYTTRELSPDMREQLLAAGLTDEDLTDRAVAEHPDAASPRLFFQRVPEAKQAKNRVHLDISAADGQHATREQVDAEMRRLRELGAQLQHTHDAAWGPFPEYHHVMTDPEGNELCVQ